MGENIAEAYKSSGFIDHIQTTNIEGKQDFAGKFDA